MNKNQSEVYIIAGDESGPNADFLNYNDSKMLP